MTDSQKLLATYVNDRSEAAFEEILRRYIDLVYSTALRLVDQDSHMAEDVCQAVFIDLAQMASRLSSSTMLGGWLHRHTCFVARNVMRRERARRLREQRFMEMKALETNSDEDLQKIAPILDEAINKLSEKDRKAIILRFLEQQDFRSLGEALGSNEDAARMRVGRALEKLRLILKREDAVISLPSLAAALSAGAMATARGELAGTILKAATIGTASTSGTTLGLLKIMAMSKAKAGVIGVVALTTVLTPTLLQRGTISQLRQENQSLHEQLATLSMERDRNAELLKRAKEMAALSSEERSELMKLRNEVGSLRSAKAENEKARKAQAQAPTPADGTPEKPDELREPIARESWQFAGFSTPENALESMAWAMNTGDLEKFMQGLSPKTQQNFARMFEGKSPNEITAMLNEQIKGLEGLRFRRKPDSGENVVRFVLVYHEQDNGTVRTRDEAILTFANVGGEWKMDE